MATELHDSHLFRADDCAFLRVGHTFVGLFWGVFSDRQAHLFAAAAEVFLRDAPEQFGVILAVSSEIPAPSPSLHAHLQRTIHRLGLRCDHMAGAVLGHGDHSMTWCSNMRALLSAAPGIDRLRVFPSLARALRWSERVAATPGFDAVRAEEVILGACPAAHPAVSGAWLRSWTRSEPSDVWG